METSRRDFLTGAATVAGVAASGDLAHAEDPSDVALRVKSLESLLVEKGIVDRVALDALVDTYENKVGPRNGTRVIARAWVDPSYKQGLLAQGTAAVAELGYTGEQGSDIREVKNTEKIHNLVVCTLCSCYPWPVLGLPPLGTSRRFIARVSSLTARRPEGVRDRASEGRRSSRLGQHRGPKVPRPPRAARRDREPQ